jgi:hypothetical protein
MANIGISGKDLTTGKKRPVDPTDVATDSAGNPLSNLPAYLSARSSVGGSPINWDTIDFSQGAFVTGSLITFPCTGKFLITSTLEGVFGSAMTGNIIIGGATFLSITSNEGAGGDASVTLTYLANITNTVGETLQVTGGPFTAGITNLLLQIIKISD